MSTTEDLLAAFAGESQANRKYTAFAGKADEEGYSQVAKLFRAAAEAETVHALNHLAVLGEVGATADNLRAAIEGEDYEHEEMYPVFIETAKIEGNSAAERSFSHANAVEKIHSRLYQKALEDPGALASVDYYVCQTCGNTFEGEGPAVCPICGSQSSNFKRVE